MKGTYPKISITCKSDMTDERLEISRNDDDVIDGVVCHTKLNYNQYTPSVDNFHYGIAMYSALRKIDRTKSDNSSLYYSRIHNEYLKTLVKELTQAMDKFDIEK